MNQCMSFLPKCIGSVSVAIVLGGCAMLPALGDLPEPKGIADYQTTAAFDAPTSNWPDEQWWKKYADPQLAVLINEALQASPDMAAAVARLRSAEAVSQVAGAARLPQISLNTSLTEEKMSYNAITPRSMTPSGWQDYGRMSLDFNWEIDFWGKNREALAAATSELEARKADLAQARLTLTTAIAGNYAELAYWYAARDTAAKAVEVRSKTAGLFAEKYANGLETQGSVRQADAVLAAAEGEVLRIDEEIGLLKYRIAALVGGGPDRGLRIERPKVNFTQAPGLPGELAASLLGRRPDIVAARLQAEAQRHRVGEKKAEFYPNINLSAAIGTYAWGIDRLFRDGSFIGSVGPAISLPIFTAGRLQGQLKGAYAGYEAAVANYDQAITRALHEVADAALSRKALVGRLHKGEEVVAAAADAYRIAQNRYEGGVSSYLEVLTAEDTLLTNLNSLTYLQSRAFILDIALVKALGGGYQPTTNNWLSAIHD